MSLNEFFSPLFHSVPDNQSQTKITKVKLRQIDGSGNGSCENFNSCCNFFLINKIINKTERKKEDNIKNKITREKIWRFFFYNKQNLISIFVHCFYKFNMF